ncbi:MAG: PDZ domain-containing protein [bacterium]|nr:PDZ domain-containing protein [bacterium]
MKTYFLKATAALLLLCVAMAARADANEEARRYFVRGAAAIEMAKSDADLSLAAEQFRRATEIAPDMAAAWYNLGAVESKLGHFDAAITCYKTYLKLAPKADDATKVGDEIIKLEFRQEQVAVVKSREGSWVDGDGNFFQLKNDGDKIVLQAKYHTVTDKDIVSVLYFGSGMPITSGEEMVFRLNVRGTQLAGSWSRTAVQTEKCTIPPESGEVEGDIAQKDGKMVLRFQRTTYQALTAMSLLSNDSCSKVVAGNKRSIELPLYGPLEGSMPLTVKLSYRPGTIMLKLGWNGHLAVGAVPAGSVAAAAGLKENDEILAIDGKPVSEMSAGEAIRQLYGKPDSEAELRILHKKGKQEDTVRLRRNSQSPGGVQLY